MKNSSKLAKNLGFTLIELLVVISIIGILMSLALVSYQGAKKSARDGKRKADLEQIRSALEMCRVDTGIYPSQIYDSISCGNPPQTYLSQTPKDPLDSSSYYYSSDGKTYTLCAHLEVGGTANVCGSANCGLSVCNYKLVNP